MPYSLPTFNLTINLWHPPTFFPAAPAQVIMGNLAYSRRVHSFGGNSIGEMFLLVPALTDLRSPVNQAGVSFDEVEVPAGSGRFYVVYAVDDVGKGFSNEHRCAVLVQNTGRGLWPIPMP